MYNRQTVMHWKDRVRPEMFALRNVLQILTNMSKLDCCCAPIRLVFLHYGQESVVLCSIHVRVRESPSYPVFASLLLLLFLYLALHNVNFILKNSAFPQGIFFFFLVFLLFKV